MVKHLILISSLLLITSCASRKVAIAKEETKTSIDSASVVRIDSTSEIKKNVYITENTEELEIKPLVDSLPIVINGKSYLNAVLRIKKSNKVLVDTSSEKVSKNVLKQVSKSKKETVFKKEKTIDKKANYFIYLWLLLIPIGIYFWRKFKSRLLL
jgi:rhamnose utilization protein RhaD (predicted bifunctional aldolase and dehydrogenase)